MTELVISGAGVTAAIGQGRAEFLTALLDGAQRFDVMKREGRQHGESAFLGAELPASWVPPGVPRRVLRAASLSAQVALATVGEAFEDAKLGAADAARVGLIVGGSNVQQRELWLVHEQFRDRPAYVRPHYAVSFMDTDICGLCTEQLGIRGAAYTVGGASASGLLAVIRAAEAVECGELDACIAVGALFDLSCWEAQAFHSLGAMGSTRFAAQPSAACRPFDRERDGFIYGEGCGAVVLERAGSALARGAQPYARVAGWGVVMDANRNPNPSYAGEVAAIGRALTRAGLAAGQVDYVNPHGTGSPAGDETEVAALVACGLAHARINATKSITGHALSAAGSVEVVATLLQMRAAALHPTLNLNDPISDECNWVRGEALAAPVRNALKLSLGFGGINAAMCLQNWAD